MTATREGSPIFVAMSARSAAQRWGCVKRMSAEPVAPTPGGVAHDVRAELGERCAGTAAWRAVSERALKTSLLACHEADA